MSGGKRYQIEPIGYIRRVEGEITIDLLEPYRAGLQQIGFFSHVMVLWWANRHDNPEHRAVLDTVPPYAPDMVTGIFATRASYRPNPVGLTTCTILDVDEEQGTITVADIDAFDGTPVIDLKAYFPVCDRVREAYIAPWLEGWPEWMPDAGLGLEDYELE